MRERPIIFSSEMVKAILEGRKTQTRRPIRPQPNSWKFPDSVEWSKGGISYHCPPEGLIPFNPYGIPGDRLWVRETFHIDKLPGFPDSSKTIHYRADPDVISQSWKGKWKSSRLMPRWVSRITLEILNVKVERVQEISGTDSTKEGCGKDIPDFELLHYGGYKKARKEFQQLWDSIYSKKGMGWNQNSWVWVIDFKRII